MLRANRLVKATLFAILLLVGALGSGAAWQVEAPHARHSDSPLAETVKIAHLNTQQTIVVDWGAAPLAAAPASARAAAEALLGKHDVVLGAAEREALAALDGLAPDVSAALAGVLVAFSAYEDAAADPALGTRGVTAAPAVLLDEMVVLDELVQEPLVAPAPLDFAPFFIIDLGTHDNWWKDDVLLLIDAGGNDTYWNNAGGNNIGARSCGSGPSDPTQARRGAALLDLDGNDTYRPVASCGVNGGAHQGAGLLVDAAGDDVYTARCCAANGGAWDGVGMLLDATGSDRYTADDTGVNGGLFGNGAAMLVDREGDDVYTAGSNAVNGGVVGRGLGLLYDGAGSDAYAERDPGASGTDRTVAPKGSAGAQVDRET